MTAEPLARARIEIDAPADQIYALVSDLRGMAQMAEEFQGGRWLRGTAGEVGALFLGHNRRGRRHWWTIATVTDAEPGRRFGFTVRWMGLPISRWQYDIEQNGSGCHVTESWWDRRPNWFKPIGGFASGSKDRPAENQHNIERTLERIKSVAEGRTALP
jgi:polyketide cyclase/dehydrase/lipid transport protein